MFPRAYFAASYFAPRYWPKVGGGGPPPAFGAGHVEVSLRLLGVALTGTTPAWHCRTAVGLAATCITEVRRL